MFHNILYPNEAEMDVVRDFNINIIAEKTQMS